MPIPRAFRVWFAFEGDIDRRTYLVHGLALMSVKYAVDAVLIRATTGLSWAPWDYVTSVPLVSSRIAAVGPGWVGPILLAWTLPFLWIGVTLTLRRLVNAGYSPWYCVLFFVPVLSYALMTVLTVLPERGVTDAVATPREENGSRGRAVAATAAGAAVGLTMLYLGVVLFESYGFALFLGSPFGVGLVAGFVYNRRYSGTANETHGIATLATVFSALIAFVVGFEGIVCLLMLAPLGLIVALMGGSVGRAIAHSGGRSMEGVFVLCILPTSIALEPPVEAGSLRRVDSSVEVLASADVVWESVVAFPDLEPPGEAIFRLGVAYPVSAHIEGSGVGAVRYCVFSTGAFVEPITAWEPGVRLAFDVDASPAPLRELTPYRVDPPHLEGYLVARRGEFRIIDLGGGRVRLEGTTWYEQRLKPEVYWSAFSDRIISAIHGRVLRHVARTAETGTP